MIDLSEMAEAVNVALAEGNTCLVGTASADGQPDIAFKGSMMVYDRDHLAFWERSGGETLRNLQANPRAVVLYRSRERRVNWRFFGRVELHPEGELREQIMARVIEGELERDPERIGIGVLIRVDRVLQGRDEIQRREE
jgi:pyridoxine/pyridoxamine 5'-phosphate oxidase